MHSHHSHSGTFCAHASADTSPASMLNLASKRGFKLYCLSEHVPRALNSQLYPEEKSANLTPSDLLQRFEAYLIEARRCADVWKGSGKTMEVLVGAELENVDDSCIDFLESILNGSSSNSSSSRSSRSSSTQAIATRTGPRAGKGRVDYLIGSLHHVDAIPIDFDEPTFRKALDRFRQTNEGEARGDLRAHLRLILRYLEQQFQLLDHFRPEVIGHFDLCRLYLPSTPMTKAAASEMEVIDDPIFAGLITQVDKAVSRNVSLVCSYGGLFEVNSASVRKGWATPYPAKDVLDVILAHGGRLCLSDDAHAHAQVGLNFHKIKQYLQQNNVKEIWALEAKDGGTPATATPFPRGTRAVRVANWETHSFWG